MLVSYSYSSYYALPLRERMESSAVKNAFRDLNELSGEGTISESRCREWFARFKFSLEDTKPKIRRKKKNA